MPETVEEQIVALLVLQIMERFAPERSSERNWRMGRRCTSTTDGGRQRGGNSACAPGTRGEAPNHFPEAQFEATRRAEG